MFNLTNDLNAGNKASAGFSIPALKLILLVLVLTGTIQTSAQNFFPLQADNKYITETEKHSHGYDHPDNSWNYYEYFYDSTYVNDSISFNNLIYYKHGEYYYYLDDATNKLYIKIGNESKLAVDFAASAGPSDTLYFNNEPREYENSGVYIDTAFGEERQFYKISKTIVITQPPFGIPKERWVYEFIFIDGIGLYKEIKNYLYDEFDSWWNYDYTHTNMFNYVNGNYFVEMRALNEKSISLINNSKILLNWNYQFVRDGFKIERRRSDEIDFSVLEVVPKNVKEFYDTTVTGGYTYYYIIRAVKGRFISPIVKVLKVVTLEPPEITNADTSIARRVQINWNYIADSLDGFIVERRAYIDTSSSNPGWGLYSVLDTVSGDQRSFLDTNVNEFKLYMYRMYAYMDTLISLSSGQLIVEPKHPPDHPPQNLICSVTTDEIVKLEWENINTWETYTVIERRINDSLHTFEVIDILENSDTIFYDQQFDEKQQYQYRVKFINQHGASGYSNLVEITSPVFNPINAPINVTGLQLPNKNVEIKWEDMSSNESGFQIDFFDPATGWVNLKETEMNDTVYVQNLVFLTGLVTYRIYAFNPHGTSDHIEFTVDILTNINEDEELPKNFALFNNYPNPFNPTTKIKFVIPAVETGHAPSLQTELKVFDLLGREVATLINKTMHAGNYEVEFNGSNLPSGIYICNLQSGSYSESIKMVLLK